MRWPSTTRTSGSRSTWPARWPRRRQTSCAVNRGQAISFRAAGDIGGGLRPPARLDGRGHHRPARPIAPLSRRHRHLRPPPQATWQPWFIRSDVLSTVGEGVVDALAEHWTDDFVLENPCADPSMVLEGKNAVRAYLREALTIFSLRLRITDVYECHDRDVLIAEYVSEGHVTTTGTPYENRYIEVHASGREGVAAARVLQPASSHPGCPDAPEETPYTGTADPRRWRTYQPWSAPRRVNDSGRSGRAERAVLGRRGCRFRRSCRP